MNKEILNVVEAISNEKGVDKGIIFNAIESALESATRKRWGAEMEVRVVIDRNTGDYVSFRRWEVLSDDQAMDHPEHQLYQDQAQERFPEAQCGEWVEESMESIEFGRIAAQTAKQVIVQKVREAERTKIVEAYSGRIGQLLTGVVKRVERGGIILDLGDNVDALIPKDKIIPKESVRTGDRMRGCLMSVKPEPRGPQLIISRTAPELLIELFRLEVPEVGEGLIEIVGAARDPGLRAKISVRARDPRIDPVGACVGMRGSRVQAVTNELNGERVDVIKWNDNLAQYVINAMAPAEVQSIIIDEDAHSMDIAVKTENLSQAIGRGGQNVRLASQLTGWELNVMSEEQAEEKSQQESLSVMESFQHQFDIDADIAAILVREGFTSVDEVAFVPRNEMLAIEEFDEELVDELRNRAKDVLLTRAIASEEFQSDREPAEDLLQMRTMEPALAYALASQGICTMEDLAECAVDDLTGITGIDGAKAAELIMIAREPWFAEAAQG